MRPMIRRDIICSECGKHVEWVYGVRQVTCGSDECKRANERKQAKREKERSKQRSAEAKARRHASPMFNQRQAPTVPQLPGNCFLCGNPRSYAKAVCDSAACRGKFDFLVARQVERGQRDWGDSYNELDARADLAFARMTKHDTGDVASAYRTTYAKACEKLATTY